MRRTRAFAPLALAVIIAAALPGAPAAAAVSGTVYTMDLVGGALLRLDPNNGTLATIGPMTTVPDITGMVVNSQGAGYAISYGSVTEVYGVDATAPLLVPLGPVTISAVPLGDCTGMGRYGSHLVLACQLTTSPIVGYVDTTTLEFTPSIVWPIVDPPVSIATSPAGVTYGITEEGVLVRLDLALGTAAVINPTPAQSVTIQAIAFDGASLTGLLSDNTTGTLSFAVFDLVTGDAFAGVPLAQQAFRTRAIAVVAALGAGAPPPGPAPSSLPATGAGSVPLEAFAIAMGLLAIGAAGLLARKARSPRGRISRLDAGD